MNETTEAIVIHVDGMHALDVRRIRDAVNLSLRNAEIRAAYWAKRKRKVPKPRALSDLAAEYSLSEDAIHSAVWPR
ncbi:MAG: hypothetical protein AAFP15_01955 [Bacteroidota bacterium]